MLPRRHILDVWEFVKDDDTLISMATVTLAIDALKYMDPDSRRDHLVEALEFNEFICYMHPSQRPRNRSLLFHVVSDMLGLLMYGVPRKSKPMLENLQSVNYSRKNMEEIYPVTGVWETLKARVYRKKHGARSIIEGFIKKIRIEMDVLDRHPFVEDVFAASRKRIKEWVPSLADYYGRDPSTVVEAYQKWWSTWFCREDREKVLAAMVERLITQAERDFGVKLERGAILAAVDSQKEVGNRENRLFSEWYRKGVNLLLKM